MLYEKDKNEKKIVKFLREIAVVVIGVAITLSASYWVSNRNAGRDTYLYLSAIKLELEENISSFEEYKKNILQSSINYSNYLRSHEKKSLNLDSLLFYRNATAFNNTPMTIKANALDMFKTSGNMRLIKDKKLLLSLWESYAKLDELKQGFEEIQVMKMDEIKKYFYLNSLPDEELLKDPPMYDFYVNMYVPRIQQDMINYTLTFLEETKSMIE
jgi:hypothetical protein